jgi:DNA-binding response OmpR family regulator
MEANGTAQAGRLASAPTRGGTNLPRRILVVDDEPAVRLFSTAVLRRSGYEVDAAEDGAAGWEALHAKNYDLLITDNQMPKISGVELIDKLHDSHMELPVIMASGAFPADELSRNPPLHLAAALSKPFSGDQLLRTVNSVLGENENAPECLERRPSWRSQPSADRLSI